jgi:hypothetical protein
MKVYVSQTRNTGKGLFAKRGIKKGETVFIAKGKLVKDCYGPDYHIGPNWLTIKRGLWLDPFGDTPWTFINHSCSPNSGLKGKVTVVAMKDIRKGEEVTIDYSTTEEDPYWKMKCKCGKKGCRGQ